MSPTDTNALSVLATRLEYAYLPGYCQARGYSISGFKRESLSNVTPFDAVNFLRAVEEKLVDIQPNGTFELPPGNDEVLFWEGRKAKQPRPITLWLEPVITLASIARLHKDFGWPLKLLGTQPETWAFDLSASTHSAPNYLVGEVKKTTRELDRLLEDMQSFCSEAPLRAEPGKSDRRRNSWRKVSRLRGTTSSLFWAVGPGGYEKLFRVVRDGDRIELSDISLDQMHYQVISRGVA